jgi:hypothetical protein
MAETFPPKKLTGSALKWIAIVTMFLDHVGATLALSWYYQAPDHARYELYGTLRVIGRIAFPIFCFLLVEGFCHTRNRGKYAARLGLFAIVAEIPFDIAFNYPQNGLVEWGSQNVFFTLFLGLIALCLWKALADRLPPQAQFAAVILPGILCYGAAEALSTDYSGFGVLLIAALGVGRGLPDEGRQEPEWKRRYLQAALGSLAILYYCWSRDNWIEIYAILGLVLTLFYNGQRGRGGKWFFYGFYPVHLLILGLLNQLLF